MQSAAESENRAGAQTRTGGSRVNRPVTQPTSETSGIQPESVPVPTAEIRPVLWRYLEGESLRQTAREVGMSPTGLSNFLNGAKPYTPTVRKLRAWYEEKRQGT